MTTYTPKTGAPCHCRPGQQRDNRPACEGTGQQIDFAAIHARRRAVEAKPAPVAQHTPAPWGYRRAYDNGEPCGYVITPQGYDLSTSNEDTTEADARLIAAAPELLAALERIVRAHDSGNNGAYMGEAILCPMFADQARAAIEKAKGGTP